MKSSDEFTVIRILSFEWDKGICWFLCPLWFVCLHSWGSSLYLKLFLGLEISSLCNGILTVKIIYVIDLLIRQKLPLSDTQKDPSLLFQVHWKYGAWITKQAHSEADIHNSFDKTTQNDKNLAAEWCDLIFHRNLQINVSISNCIAIFFILFFFFWNSGT